MHTVVLRACLFALLVVVARPVLAEAAADTDADATPQAQIEHYQQALENARQVIDDLRAQLARSEQRIADLERTLRDNGLAGEDVRASADAAAAERAAREEAERQRRAEGLRRMEEARQRRIAEIRREPRRRDTDPAWYYTWQIGYINAGKRTTTFVKTNDDGTVVFQGDRNVIDRRQIVLRGTFENLAQRPYRYTFEIRVAESGGVVQSTRYQTPVMLPGDLHRWEVTMAVPDSLKINIADIGNVRADALEPDDVLPPMTEPATANPPTLPDEGAAGRAGSGEAS